RHSLVGAGALVTEGKVFPERSLILGAPAKAVRTLSDEEVAALQRSAKDYAARAAHYQTSLHPL
ncbi:gamma carbonic anhydrase family protein, partial [Castellaniella sp.]